MGKDNIAVNDWLSKKERFADFFNAAAFHGEQVIKPEDLTEIDRETDIILPDKNGKETGIQRYRDIAMYWKSNTKLVILACEVQKKIHYAMSVRNMLYDGLLYEKRINELWDVHMHNGDKPTDSEYLLHCFREDTIIPVITLVFYYGLEKWDGKKNLYDMFDIEDGHVKDCLTELVPNYWINLIDIGNPKEDYLFQTDLQTVFPMLQLRKDKNELINYINNNREYFCNLNIDTVRALGAFLGSEKLIAETIKNADLEKGEELFDMCPALEELFQDGVNEGIEKGIEHLIKALKSFEIPNESILLKVMEEYQLSEAEAETAVAKYVV